jgi:hypothetical protein
MRLRAFVPATVAAVLSACAGGGPASPPGIAYSVPDPASVVYEQGDTTNIDIDAGGQSMQARVLIGTTMRASFARAPDGVEVTLDVENLDARMNNPAAGTVRADESTIDAPVVFTMDRRGRATLVSEPDLDDNTGQFFQPLSIVHGMFPRLPGRAVGLGGSWVDTVHVDGKQGAGTVKATTVLTYTVAGDTVLAGRNLVRFDFEGVVESVSRGVTGGMDFTQDAKGDMTGYVLWDMQRSLVVESFSEGEARGSMEIAAAPFPLGMRMRSHTRLKLKEGM